MHNRYKYKKIIESLYREFIILNKEDHVNSILWNGGIIKIRGIILGYTTYPLRVYHVPY
jgi:hypothetical protein